MVPAAITQMPREMKKSSRRVNLQQKGRRTFSPLYSTATGCTHLPPLPRPHRLHGISRASGEERSFPMMIGVVNDDGPGGHHSDAGGDENVV